MGDFEKALAFTLAEERGYANHPKDRGGETYRGLSRKVHSDWPGWRAVDAHKRRGELSAHSLLPELEDSVRERYRSAYWDAISGDDLPPRTALSLFDYAVHAGPTRAVKRLQSLLGAEADGRVGPQTLEKLSHFGDTYAARRLLRERALSFEEIARSDPSQREFLRGWRQRAERLARHITPEPEEFGLPPQAKTRKSPGLPWRTGPVRFDFPWRPKSEQGPSGAAPASGSFGR